MTQPNAEWTADRGRSAAPHPITASWKIAFLLWPALILMGVALVGTNRVTATQEAADHPAPPFIKIGKNYINMSRVSHIFDDPGQPLPPGSISICFSGGSQDYMNLYNEDAQVFRDTIAKLSSDMTPKGSGDAPSKKATAKKAPAAAKKAGTVLNEADIP